MLISHVAEANKGRASALRGHVRNLQATQAGKAKSAPTTMIKSEVESGTKRKSDSGDEPGAKRPKLEQPS